jgi:uncharacterized protein with PCYCGC motif
MKFQRLASGILLMASVLPAAAQMQMPNDTPAFNVKPPAPGAKLPPVLKPAQLAPENTRYPFQAKAYLIAARIHRVLHQLPCYCHCDRGMGHKSLRSCYTDQHGADCNICLQELYYTDQMLKQGKTVKQIRDGIMHGEYQHVDLQKV